MWPNCMCLFIQCLALIIVIIYIHLTKFESKIDTETIIHSISQMTSLEELVLWENDLSRDESLNNILSKLTSMKKLDMTQCHLSQLPEG